MRWKPGVAIAATAVVFSGAITAAMPRLVPDVPSGERQLGRTVVEPAYDAEAGGLIYLMTPIGAPFPSKANAHAVSPLYLVVYPNSASGAVGVMNCAHQPSDNCPDHGDDIAMLAASAVPSIYGAADGSGVWGHDHIVDGPGGADFNVAWQVHVILFTDASATTTHVTSDAQIDHLVNDTHQAIEIVTPIVFNCQVTSARTYWRGTPLGAERP